MKQLRFGYIRGGKTSFPINITDSEVFLPWSGRFLARNATTGYGELADVGDLATLIGFAEAPIRTAGSETTSSDVYNCICDLTAVFRIPLIYDSSTYRVNWSVALMYESCDLKVSTVQYANPTVATSKQIILVGGQAATGTTITYADGWVDCMLNYHTMLNLAVGG